MNIQNSKLKIQNSRDFPDFWSRRDNAQTHVFEFAPLGMPARITANQPAVLDAARLSAGRFSRAPAADSPPVQVQVVVTRRGGGPLPPNLPDRLAYTGVGDWISLSAGSWGYGFASLSYRQAVAVLSPELAAATRLVSRYI
ncbi:MAG: hypothetical protein D6784_16480, partial [Chloroflexi bacterium]